MLNKFEEGEMLAIRPDLFCKRKRVGHVVAISSRTGGYCSGTGKVIPSGDYVYYIRFISKAKNPPIYTYSQSFICSGK